MWPAGQSRGDNKGKYTLRPWVFGGLPPSGERVEESSEPQSEREILR